jgi:hypothetical protein
MKQLFLDLYESIKWAINQLLMDWGV